MAVMQAETFTLNPQIDAAALARQFAAEGRVQIIDLLPERQALMLASMLRERGDWKQVLNSGDKIFELDRATRAAMSAEQHRTLDDAVHAGARHGFQYRYETLRVSDDRGDRLASGDLLAQFAEWLSNGDVRELMRRITGTNAIEYADAQGTAYSPGDFLTAHDDDVAGKRRHAAYVFGLSPEWRTEWGGLLLFHEQARVSGYVPRFNTLSLFRVPQLHSVSQVSRAAPHRRYSITGWLRGGPR